MTRNQIGVLLELGYLDELKKRWMKGSNKPDPLKEWKDWQKILLAFRIFAGMFTIFMLSYVYGLLSPLSTVVDMAERAMIAIIFLILVFGFGFLMLVVNIVNMNSFYRDLKLLMHVLYPVGIFQSFIRISILDLENQAEQFLFSCARGIRVDEMQCGINSEQAKYARKYYKRIRKILRRFDFGALKDDKYFTDNRTVQQLTTLTENPTLHSVPPTA